MRRIEFFEDRHKDVSTRQVVRRRLFAAALEAVTTKFGGEDRRRRRRIARSLARTDWRKKATATEVAA